MKGYVAGVDLGGTQIVSGIVDVRGRVKSLDERPTCSDRGAREVLSRIADGVKAASASAGIPLSRLDAIGVGSPGPLDPKRGVVLYSENLGWRNVRLAETLRRTLEKRVFIENDANVAALGETWAGAGKGEKVVLGLTLGTGVGGGLVLGGRLYEGAWDVGCEIGHIVVDPRGPKTRYGNRGVLEQYASATGIVRLAVLEGIAARKGGKRLTSRDVVQLARAGDRRARRAMEQAGRMLGVGLTTALHLLNPSMVIFAGGVSAAGRWLFDPMRRELKARCFTASLRGVKFRRARRGGSMGVVGAARLALLRLEEKA